MLVVRGESRLGAEELLRRAKGKRVVLLDAGKIDSVEELELAHALAKKSLGDGTAISKNLGIEFVLWLSGKKDIRRAFEEIGYRKGKDLIAVSFGMGKKELIAELEMKEKKLGLEKEAGWEAVERISLGRVS
ncbi:MAG: KEOPS complex subunit Cgi121 [Candidatus Micrarchaeia archaeon]|jgi:tRNA threonylcarbamoyladenosine modification (KEOPS) complex Cgi121 subunit